MELKLNTLNLTYSAHDKRMLLTNSKIYFNYQGKENATKGLPIQTEQTDLVKEYLNSIKGVYKCQCDEMEGNITINPVNLTDGKLNVNLKLAINEKIYKFNFKLGEKEYDKISK